MDRYFEVRMLVKDESLRIKDIVKQTGYDKGHVSRLRKASRLDKLIANAVAAEREACALIAKDWDASHPHTNYGACISNAIRARGEL